MLNWNNIPLQMKNEEVKYYYKILKRKKVNFFLKRVFDIIFSLALLVLLSPIMLIVAVLIKFDSDGPIFYRQVRVTQFGREFKIFKFRTMFTSKEKQVEITVGDDPRITNIGKKIRGLRIDELPQLMNIFLGDMSFVGTRPEVPKFVACYTDEMKATLLVKAGVTSLASIEYKDEAKILDMSKNPETDYIQIILPEKMKINLSELEKFNIFNDLKVIILTFFKVFK
ncbi:sugar transferase [Vagococcus carniphilus]|uniref:sugar transferase n=1 Tax=Vagococcus carniphilus TaxID=218144 RepID=UPI003B5C14F3